MQYKFYLDGNLVENPLGWDKMIRKVVRDKELKAVLLNLDADLTFQGEGYFYLKSLFDESYCGQVKIDIHQSRDEGQTFYQRYTGTLFVTEMEFDEFKCYCKVKVTDNSYYAHISANKNIETSLLGGRSKNSPNDYNITPCQIRKFKLFDPTNCNYFSNTEDFGSFVVDDALRYLMDFMTDKQVEYISPIFGAGGKYQYLTLTFGYAIRHNGIVHDGGSSINENQFVANLPKISFQKLFDELNRFFNLGMYVEINPATGKPRIIIDEWKNLFKQSPSTTFTNLPNLIVSTSAQDIYSQVKFGGTTEDAPALSFPTGLRFIGFLEESFFSVTNCNVDNTLDLSGDFIVDTNVIEHISVTSIDVGGGNFGDTSYDKDWFFIDSDYIVGGDYFQAKQSNWLTDAPPCYYNELFMNQNTSQRYFGFVPAAIADYLGPAIDARFHSELTVQQPTSGWLSSFFPYTHIHFNDDSSFPPNSDPTGAYNNSTFEFTAPADGGYTFYVSRNMKFIAGGVVGDNVTTRLICKLRRYDSLSVLLAEYTIIDHQTVLPAGIESQEYFNGTRTIFLLATEKVSVSFESTELVLFKFLPYAIGADKTTFACISSLNGGGIYSNDDPSKYPIVKNKFRTEISKTQTDAIELNPLSMITFYITLQNIKAGFIEDISIDEFNGTIEAVLIQGVGYPPFDACEDELGDELFSNNLFEDPNTYWIAAIGDLTDWVFSSPGADYIGSTIPTLAALLGTFPITTTSPTGVYKTVLRVEGMTTGECWIDVGGGCVGTHRFADGTYIENVNCPGALDFSLVYCTTDFDGRITFASIKPINKLCDNGCIEGYGANALPNYRFLLGDNGEWEKNPPLAWIIDSTGAQHISNEDPMTSANLYTDVITNQTSPTGKWRITVLVTGMTQGNYQANAGGHIGVLQFANGTYSEILDLAGDPLAYFRLIVSGDFDGKVVLIKAEPLLNEC